MTLGQKLKTLRAERDWTQLELAKRAGLDRGYIANLEIDGVKKPAGQVFIKLAHAFNIPTENLYVAAGYIKEVYRVQRPETSEDILERLRVSISSTVPIYEEFPFHAGSPVLPVDQVAVIKYRARGRNLEGYIAQGNCLEPDIKDGNIIIIDRDAQIDNGDIVAALVDGELYLARLRKIAGELYLENNNGRIKLEEAQVSAPVIEVRRRLK